MIKWFYAVQFWWLMKRAASHVRKANKLKEKAGVALILAGASANQIKKDINDDTIYILVPRGTKLDPAWFTEDEAAQYCQSAKANAISLSRFRDEAIKQIQRQTKEEK